MRVKILAIFAKLIGIQFKVDGIPYGAANRKKPHYLGGSDASDAVTTSD